MDNPPCVFGCLSDYESMFVNNDAAIIDVRAVLVSKSGARATFRMHFIRSDSLSTCYLRPFRSILRIDNCLIVDSAYENLGGG